MISGEPFVGRVNERATLLKHIADAASGRGGVTLIGGEAGSGKSALLRIVFDSQGPDRLPGFAGRCPGPQETPPFGPWVEIVDRLKRELGWDTGALPRPFGEASAQWGAYELAGALGHWFGHRELPLVLIIEDLHWADPASLDVLRHLTAQLPDWPVRLICTYRTDELARNHPLWRLLPELQRAGADRILLERLTLADVTELTAMVANEVSSAQRANGEGAFHLPVEETAALIYERTEGLALFAREMLQQLARTGELPKAGDPVPQNLHQAIDSKLNRLPAAALEVLEPAAVVGEFFSFDVLVEIVDFSEDELSEALEQAVARHVIRPRGTDGNRFAFDHALFREAILMGVIGSRRRRWHARIAAALEKRREVDPDVVAYHLLQANDPRAADHLISAADRARHLGAITQATQQYEQALSLLNSQDPRRAEILLMLGWCLRERDPVTAIAVLGEAAEEARAHGQTAVTLWAKHALLLLTGERNLSTFFTEANAMMAEEENFLHDPEYQRLETELYGGVAGFPRVASLLIKALTLSGAPDKAKAQMDEIAGRALPSAEREIAAARMVLSLLTGRLAAAADQCGRAADLAHSLRRYPQAIHLRASELMTRLIGPADPPDRLDLVAQQLAQLEEEAWRHAGYAPLRRGYSLTGVYRFFRGDWEGGYHHVVEAARQDPTAYLGTLVFYAASILMECGDAQSALPFAEALPPFRSGDPFVTRNNLMTLPHALKAHVYTALGDLGKAREWLEAAERWPALSTAPFFHSNVLFSWSTYHLYAGDLKASWKAACGAQQTAEAAASSLMRIRSHRRLGELAALFGEIDVALGHFEESLSLARKCHFPFEVAHTLLVRGRSLAERPERIADLTAAYDTYVAAGATPAVHWVREALLEGGDPSALEPNRDSGDRLDPLSSPYHDRSDHHRWPQGGERARGSESGPDSPSPHGLTHRQVEVISLVCKGLTDREIAARLYISPKTVDRHLRNIFNKLGVSNRTELAAFATRQGIVG